MTEAQVALAVDVDAARLPVPADELATLLGRAAGACGFAGALSVAIVDDAAMRIVNRDFHACDEPTDVLAFPLEGGPDGPGFAAEVVVSLDTAVREAQARGVAPLSELVLYVVHGTLHLLGYDDHDAGEARRMHGRTLEILTGLGLENRLELPDDEEPCANDDAR